MQLFNLTPFAAERVVTSSLAGRDTLLVVVKATYSLRQLDRGVPRRAEVQRPVALVDEYVGDPGQSSLLLSHDLVPEKPSAEVILTGHVTPRKTGETSLDVGLQLGSVAKVVRVFGDRVWDKGALFGLKSSAPKPLERVPLLWERAFGGVDETTQERFDTNPIGCGFVGKKSKAKLAGQPVPNLVDPRAPIEAPSEAGKAAGFGFLAPAWRDRKQHAGTYDEAWAKDVSPFLPKDFDPRYFLGAPRDQQLDKFPVGGERGRVTSAHQFDFELPRVRLDLSAMMDGVLEPLPARCDTVLIDLDTSELQLVWRGRLDVQDRLDEVRWIRAAEADA